ncbi:flagellar hook-associated protein FlgK [Albibacillus kandeliae]|uniref:flagellar hook-associated protein FlgK n=1 Tax=Albibacillus kandeliae TaxID=2174228 RepID=UPI000D68C65A|nr:flagellar hook-associated protein FlgK [Albibacillus kandeliae]
MSITSAFNIARSGLITSSQQASTVSTNIANAGSENYGRRSLSVTTTSTGAAVATSVNRAVDSSLSAMYRDEIAAMSKQDTIASGLTVYSATLGEVDDASSPVQMLTDLQTSLDQLYNDPSDTTLQASVVQAAQDLAEGLNELSETISDTAAAATKDLQSDITDANELLADVANLNRRIALAQEGSDTYATLQDQLDGKLNQLSEFMDFSTKTDSSGRVSVYTTGGLRLVEGETSFELSFDQTTGTLSADGQDITPPNRAGINEGKIAGNIELLNETLPQMQLQLDEFARAVIVTFEQADASLSTGDAGLFTDAGAAYDSSNLTGLAARISVNSAVVPEEGGELWRIRDGMSATTEGTSGESSQIGAFIDAMSTDQSFDTAAGITSNATLVEYASLMVATQQNVVAEAETSYEELATSAAAIDTARLNAQGVNIDDELQQLLLIEQSYAANTQVVSTLVAMLDALLEAT